MVRLEELFSNWSSLFSLRFGEGDLCPFSFLEGEKSSFSSPSMVSWERDSSCVSTRALEAIKDFQKVEVAHLYNYFYK